MKNIFIFEIQNKNNNDIFSYIKLKYILYYLIKYNQQIKQRNEKINI